MIAHRSSLIGWFLSLNAFAIAVKLLLMHTYRSTDFEVHRNWLAITHSLPVNKWYTDNTSQWTLDYPPLFAWFERSLAFFAQFADDQMLVVSNHDYASKATVIFQRSSVIVTDALLASAVWDAAQLPVDADRYRSDLTISNKKIVFMFASICNAGLLLVDHIHFQYNGMLLGVFLIAMVLFIRGRFVLSAIVFCLLFNLKHIFLYISPIVFIMFLKHYCFAIYYQGGSFLFAFVRLASVVIAVFLFSFGPFLWQIGEVLSRLFPFKRGLCHAYWAPNFWALYAFADKALSMLMSGDATTASMTGGLVQTSSFAILPDVTPLATLLATCCAIAPLLIAIIRFETRRENLIDCCTLCAFSSFMFGWHVHEKAILMVLLPMGLACLIQKHSWQIYFNLSFFATYSLFPLLFTPFEYLIKCSVFVLYHFVLAYAIRSRFNESLIDMGLFLLLPLVEIYASGFHHYLLPRYEFLPLLVISVFSAVAISVCFVRFYISVLRQLRAQS